MGFIICLLTLFVSFLAWQVLKLYSRVEKIEEKQNIEDDNEAD